jgi:hypothetical protein
VKLFSRLFGTSSDAPLASLSTDTPASGATDARSEVIGKLPDGPELRALAGLAPTRERVRVPAEERAAQARFAQLIDAGGVDVAALSAAGRGNIAWLAIAAQCAQSTILNEAMAEIGNSEDIAFLVMHGPMSRIRQIAAEAVQDPAQLRELLKQVRDKDKSVYKILKQKLDVLHAHDVEAAALMAEIESICTALERHSHRYFDALYTGVFEHHHHRWLALTVEPDPAQKIKAADAIARCQEVIAEHARQLAQQMEREAAAAAAREAQQQAIAAAEAHAAAKAQVDAEAAARDQEVNAAALAVDEAARNERAAAEQQILRQIGGLLRKANAALTDGQSQAAAGLRRALDEKLAAATAAAVTVPAHFTKSVAQLDGRLNELKQWKNFAVAPKRTELIRDMELLIGSSEEPKVLAERIKSLQEDWKTTSKGIVSDASEDWERFHKASQAAYQPCRAYFEAQSKLRKENIARRQTVLDRVLAFESALNAETLDWRLLTSVLREAPLEWRSHSPVEREAARALQPEFDAAIGRLQSVLNGWYERNVSGKRGLIDSARQLLNLEDGREAVETVKRLQAQWKDIGPAPREQEQSLWREFREHCDAVFQKRQQAHAQYSAALEASTAQAAALCKEVEDVGAVTGSALTEALAKIAPWRSAFEALGELPRAEARGLQNRFERAIGQLEAQVAQQRQRDAQQSITDVFEAARRIRACEWASISHEPEPARTALHQETEAFLAGIKRGPSGSNQALKEMLGKTESANDAGLAEREKALRILCIRCEIIQDAATPVEDESLRREYQVQRLMQGMGQGHTGSPDWNAMLVEWIRISAITPAVHDALQQRFMRSWLTNAATAKRAAERAAEQPMRREQPARRERPQWRARS